MAGTGQILLAEKENGPATFEAIATAFAYPEPITKALLAAGLRTLEDFRYSMTTLEDVDAWFEKQKFDKENALVNKARLKMAWDSLRKQLAVKDNFNMRVDVEDIDAIMDAAELCNLKDLFWARHKITFPSYLQPSDALVSRCYREINKRLLQVFSMDSVKTLLHQISTDRKKRKLAGDLWVVEEQSLDPLYDVSQYLQRLQTYLVALGLAGVRKRSTAPNSERVGADTTQVVEVPYDVLMEYYNRAAKSAAERGPAALSWLRAQDCEERAMWVEHFRGSDKTLGEVIKAAMLRRDAHWSSESGGGRFSTPERNQSRGKGGGTSPGQRKPLQGAFGGKPQPKKGAAGSPKGKGRYANKMKDGTPLCSAFQRGACQTKGKGCGKGQHRCAWIIEGDRVCGAPGHGASTCPLKR